MGRTYLGDLGMQMNPRNCQNLNLQSRITVVITYILFLVIPNPKSKFEMRNKYFSFYGFLKVSITLVSIFARGGNKILGNYKVTRFT